MKILIIAPYTFLPGEGPINRFFYLAKLLAKKNEVTLVTSSFNHQEKKQRKTQYENLNFKLKIIHEPGYKKNLSLMRLISHYIFVRKFKKWFALNKYKYDHVYSSYPLIETNIYLGKIKTCCGFELIIDIQDIWPESISTAIQFIKKIPFFLVPFSWKANQAYKAADKLVAVSKKYLNRAKLVNNKAKGLTIYIGSDFKYIKKTKPKNLDKTKVHFLYMGSMNGSYDIETLLSAFKIFEIEKQNFVLHLAGGGQKNKKIKSLLGKNIIFYDWMPYKDVMSLGKSVDFFINPIKKSSSASITNKLSDYISLMKPIISCQDCDEAKKLIKITGGEFYDSGSVNSLVFSIKKIVKNRPNKSLFAIKKIIRNFDRQITYPLIEEFIREPL